MYTYFQPRISVEQEETDIKEMIDEEYERKEQENRDYYKQIEEEYYRYEQHQVSAFRRQQQVTDYHSPLLLPQDRESGCHNTTPDALL